MGQGNAGTMPDTALHLYTVAIVYTQRNSRILNYRSRRIKVVNPGERKFSRPLHRGEIVLLTEFEI